MFVYKDYEVDVEAEILFGRVLDINDVVTFQGKTVAEARQEFQNSIDDYLYFCEELGREPDRPFFGCKLTTCLPPSGCLFCQSANIASRS